MTFPRKLSIPSSEKYLRIVVSVRGSFDVNAQGHIRRCDMPEMGFSSSWLFLGVSHHHWNNHITASLQAIWKDPQIALNGIVWDRDHGTMRTWGGYKIPRITSAHFRTDN